MLPAVDDELDEVVAAGGADEVVRAAEVEAARVVVALVVAAAAVRLAADA